MGTINRNQVSKVDVTKACKDALKKLNQINANKNISFNENIALEYFKNFQILLNNNCLKTEHIENLSLLKGRFKAVLNSDSVDRIRIISVLTKSANNLLENNNYTTECLNIYNQLNNLKNTIGTLSLEQVKTAIGYITYLVNSCSVKLPANTFSSFTSTNTDASTLKRFQVIENGTTYNGIKFEKGMVFDGYNKGTIGSFGDKVIDAVILGKNYQINVSKVKEVSNNTPLTDFSTVTDVLEKRKQVRNVFKLAGIGGGIYLAHKMKKGTWGYVGYAFLGMISGFIVGNIISKAFIKTVPKKAMSVKDNPSTSINKPSSQVDTIINNLKQMKGIGILDFSKKEAEEELRKYLKGLSAESLSKWSLLSTNGLKMVKENPNWETIFRTDENKSKQLAEKYGLNEKLFNDTIGKMFEDSFNSGNFTFTPTN